MQPYHRRSLKFVAPAILTALRALLALPVGFVSRIALSHLCFPLRLPSILIVFSMALALPARERYGIRILCWWQI